MTLREALRTKLTCGKCAYFWDMEGVPDQGYCCYERPTVIPAMQLAPLQPGAMRPTTMGIDPPIRRDRRACHHYLPDALDG